MLSLGILVVLAGTLMGFLWNLLDRRDSIDRLATQQQGAGALIERIESDLLCGLAGQGGAAGIKGMEASLTLLTRGVWMPERAAKTGVSGDLQGSEFVFDRSSGAVRARRWSGAEASGESENICDKVELLRFRYYDGKQWAGSFDSLAKGQLPVGIEVAVWFGEPASEQEDPISTVPPQARGLPERDPDRVRLVIVPDGPVDSWKEGR